MRLFWDLETKRKAKIFRETARNFILSVHINKYPSCEQLVMCEVEKSIDASKDEIKTWGPNYNYKEWAIRVLKNISAELVCSGKFHVYTGVLKPIGGQLLNLCLRCLYELRDMGVISFDECYDQIDKIDEMIDSMG